MGRDLSAEKSSTPWRNLWYKCDWRPLRRLAEQMAI